MRDKSRSVAFCGVFTALAMIFSYVEALLPISIGIPGVKLGVANIAIIVVLYNVGSFEAVVVDVLRIALTGMLFGNMSTFLFSIAGGVLSIAVMVLLKRYSGLSMTGVSVAGGVTHNIGQVIAAVFLMQSPAIVYYLPVLLVAGSVTGIVIGSVGAMISSRVQKI